MKSVGVALAVAWAKGAVAGDVSPPNYATMWQTFRKEYPKVYTLGEEEHRFEIFKSNVDKIVSENLKGHSHTLGVTEFADMTSDEFNGIYTGGYNPGLRLKSSQPLPFPNITGDIPDAVDWVAKGAVTPVKNQQQCGSCWAFSTTGSVEGAYFLASGTLESLSEEDLVQCDHNGDQGCQGGLMDNAFGFIQKNGGICSEQAYPYSSGGGQTGKCKKGCSPVVTISGHVDVPTKDEDALKKAVSQNPVSVALEADKSVFQLYKSGVLDSPTCGTQLDHGVLIVGYGTDGGKDYWKVKNSWGPTWGENGYLRIVRGKNMCGLATQPCYPTGAKKAAPSPPAPPSPPSPPTPPTPPSPPPSPSSPHYEDPKNGCRSDEVKIQIQGIQGAACSPKCKGRRHRNKCPKDVPSGVTAQPQCALQDGSTKKKYCALICQPSSNSTKNAEQCGENASCKNVQMGIGLCTYDDDAKATGSQAVEFKPEDHQDLAIVV